MNKSIESGCKPLSIVDDGTRLVDDGKLHTVHFNIGKEAERIARDIYEQQDKLVFNYLPTETLLKLKELVEKELQKRKTML